MGVVYRARDTMLQRDVALKLIRPALAERAPQPVALSPRVPGGGDHQPPRGGDDLRGRRDRRRSALPGVGAGRGRDPQGPGLRRGALPPAEVIAIGIQLGDALAAAHEKGAIHRDIKPANLMLTPEGRLKILDFGLARLVAADDSDAGDDRPTIDQTQEGAVVGTPAYMSPEQASGMKVDARTDIFSAGCVLYELVTGNSPFQSVLGARDAAPGALRGTARPSRARWTASPSASKRCSAAPWRRTATRGPRPPANWPTACARCARGRRQSRSGVVASGARGTAAHVRDRRRGRHPGDRRWRRSWCGNGAGRAWPSPAATGSWSPMSRTSPVTRPSISRCTPRSRPISSSRTMSPSSSRTR